jgi:DNA end-binding protein Ku
MRSSWKGSIGFSIVNVPVSLGGATGDSSLPIHQHAPDGSRIKMKRVSEASGEEVAYKDIQKGYELPDGNVVMLTDEDFDEAYGAVSREAEILMFTAAGNVPDIAKSKPYFVQPGKGGERSYSLLVRVLQNTNKVAIIRFGMHQRKRLGALSATEDGYLMLEQLEWASDVRKPDFAAPNTAVSDAEVEMAAKVVEHMTKTFDHSTVEDDSAAKLNELISRRIEKGQVTGGYVGPAQANGGEQVTDLMATLAAAVKSFEPETAAKPKATRRGSARVSA